MDKDCTRRDFLALAAELPCAALLLSVCGPFEVQAEGATDSKADYFGMGIQADECIGCGRCVAACKQENNVLNEPYFFRTWVERYVFDVHGEVEVDSPNGGMDGFKPREEGEDTLRSFFVPKLCNQCDNPPCVQVCPVGATFKTDDGVILVDDEYCLGCRYCIQACPYGARYLDPRTKVADKCTFCYHRIRQGLLPACVEVCPTQARVFGKINARTSPLHRMLRMTHRQILKPHLNTEPKVFYSGIDTEVR